MDVPLCWFRSVTSKLCSPCNDTHSSNTLHILHSMQVRQQLAAQEAAAAQAAAAEVLSSRALCRRILLHLHQAVLAYKCFKQLTAAATQHRQVTVQRGVLQSWRCSAKLSKGLQQLQSRIEKRVLQLGLQAWHQGIVLQR